MGQAADDSYKEEGLALALQIDFILRVNWITGLRNGLLGDAPSTDLKTIIKPHLGSKKGKAPN